MSNTNADSDLKMDRTYGHINTETGDSSPHVDRSYVLYTNLEDGPEWDREEWHFALRLPRYIDDALQESDWEFVARKFDTREPGEVFSKLEFLVASGRLCGATAQQLQTTVARWMAENLYRVFCEKQIARGNDKWLVPSSMQRVSNPDA